MLTPAKLSEGTQAPTVGGSIYSIAPEVVVQSIRTVKADIWSLGCLVIEMITGDHPFPNLTQTQSLFKVRLSIG